VPDVYFQMSEDSQFWSDDWALDAGPGPVIGKYSGWESLAYIIDVGS
jgi:hypothetical protein